MKTSQLTKLQSFLYINQDYIDLFSMWFWDMSSSYHQELTTLLSKYINKTKGYDEINIKKFFGQIKRLIYKENSIDNKELVEFLVDKVGIGRILSFVQCTTFDYTTYFKQRNNVMEVLYPLWNEEKTKLEQRNKLCETIKSLEYVNGPLEMYIRVDKIISEIPLIESDGKDFDADRLLDSCKKYICWSDIWNIGDVVNILRNYSPFDRQLGKMCYSSTVFCLAVDLILNENVSTTSV